MKIKSNKTKFSIFTLLGIPNLLVGLLCIVCMSAFIYFSLHFSHYFVNYPWKNLVSEIIILFILALISFVITYKIIIKSSILYLFLGAIALVSTLFFLYVFSEFIVLLPYPKDIAFAQNCVNLNGKNLDLQSIQSLQGWCYDSGALFAKYKSHQCTNYDVDQFQSLFSTCNQYSSVNDSRNCIINQQKKSNTLLDLGDNVVIPSIDVGEEENRWRSE